MTTLQQGTAMDDPDFSISERLHALLPPALDDPARQRDLRTVAWLIDLRFDKVERRFDEIDRRFSSFTFDLKSTIIKLFIGLFGAMVTTILAAMAILVASTK
ncbi:MAG: hypothetical protein ACO321_07760 [Ilumatobacteraceae bacterium]